MLIVSIHSTWTALRQEFPRVLFHRTRCHWKSCEGKRLKGLLLRIIAGISISAARLCESRRGTMRIEEVCMQCLSQRKRLQCGFARQTSSPPPFSITVKFLQILFEIVYPEKVASWLCKAISLLMLSKCEWTCRQGWQRVGRTPGDLFFSYDPWFKAPLFFIRNLLNVWICRCSTRRQL